MFAPRLSEYSTPPLCSVRLSRPLAAKVRFFWSLPFRPRTANDFEQPQSDIHR